MSLSRYFWDDFTNPDESTWPNTTYFGREIPNAYNIPADASFEANSAINPFLKPDDYVCMKATGDDNGRASSKNLYQYRSFRLECKVNQINGLKIVMKFTGDDRVNLSQVELKQARSFTSTNANPFLTVKPTLVRKDVHGDGTLFYITFNLDLLSQIQTDKPFEITLAQQPGAIVSNAETGEIASAFAMASLDYMSAIFSQYEPYDFLMIPIAEGQRGEKGDKGEKGDEGDKGEKGDKGPICLSQAHPRRC